MNNVNDNDAILQRKVNKLFYLKYWDDRLLDFINLNAQSCCSTKRGQSQFCQESSMSRLDQNIYGLHKEQKKLVAKQNFDTFKTTSHFFS